MNVCRATYSPKLVMITSPFIFTSGVFILFYYFKFYSSSFSKETRLGTVLQFVGKRTLDIYLIHYILLPINLGVVTKIFIDYPMPVIEAFFSLCVASIVIVFSIILGNVIRLNPITAYWLLGVKKK